MGPALRSFGILAFFTGLLAVAGWQLFFTRTEKTALELQLAQCPVIADVSNRPFGELDFNGTDTVSTNSGFNDDFLTDKAGKVRVGLREKWGGTIFFFGHDQVNALDDTGADRGIQISVFDDSKQRSDCAEGFVGWKAVQSQNRCGRTTGVQKVSRKNGLEVLYSPLLANPNWNSKDCTSNSSAEQIRALCADPERSSVRSALRVSQSLRFVKSGVLEVEVSLTNLGDTDVISKNPTRSELPAIFAAVGNSSTTKFAWLKNRDGEIAKSSEREPSSDSPWQNIPTPDGWATFQNESSNDGLGIYWENRSASMRADRHDADSARLTSNAELTVPTHQEIRLRYYLMLGGYSQIRAQAEEIDRTLPPFGRIDSNQINTDSRTVNFRGWVLDNKQVTELELWVDGKKESALKLVEQRDDVCSVYPGYSMCQKGHARVGFEGNYRRPAGTGCDRPVEIRARDSDGNWRIIARKSISPVVY